MSLEQDLADALRTWIDELSPHTKRAYERGLVQFAEYLVETEVIAPTPKPTGSDSRAPARRDALAGRSDLVGRAGEHLLSLGQGKANALVQAYIQHLSAVDQDTGVPSLTRDTVKQRISALRWAIREARRRGMVSWGLDVVLPRAMKDPETGRVRVKAGRDMRGPAPSVVGEMLRLADSRSDGGRWKLIVSLIAHETLREHEICALDLADVDLEQRTFSVVRKKEDASTLLPMSEPTSTVMARWKSERGDASGPLLWGSKHGVVVPGTRLTTRGVYHVVHTLGKACGVSTSPHKVRHTAITLGQLVREELSIPVQDAMERAGHKNPDTHHRYLDKDIENMRRLSDGVARLLRPEPPEDP